MHCELEGIAAVYGIVEMTPSDSGGCVYVRVTPPSTYTPGKSWLSERHDSNVPLRYAAGALRAMSVDASLLE